MNDVFDKFKSDKGPLGRFQHLADGYFMFPKLEGKAGPRMKFRGKDVLVWSINDYLGMANHPDVREADTQGAKDYGMAYPMGARMMSGDTVIHEELERQLADFVGKETAYLLNYGYQGMVSIIDSLVSRNDIIVYDSDSHACILDGVRLHIGKHFVYPHNDMENLRKQLGRALKIAETTGGGILIVLEGVFGMVGDLGNLKDILALKEEFNFRLLLDDAHGFGTMSAKGAGTAKYFGVENEVDVYFATFAKSMAGIGGFVAGEKYIIDYLKYNMRSQVFAKSLPMPMVIGAFKRLELIRGSDDQYKKMWEITNALQKGLREKGFNLGSTESPVTPVYLSGTIPEAAQVVVDLRENYNIFCTVVLYPVVPKDVILMRLIPTASHSLEDVEYTVNSFAEVKEKLETGKYNQDEIPDVSIKA